MEHLNEPFYTVEAFCTYADAIWIYQKNGLDESFTSMNDGEEIARFAYEADAREYFKKHKFGKMIIWDPMDYDPASPDIGIEYYYLVKYESRIDYLNDNGKIIDCSKGTITSRQIRNLFKKCSGIDLKKLADQYEGS